MLEAQIFGIDNGAALLIAVYVLGALAWLVKGDY